MAKFIKEYLNALTPEQSKDLIDKFIADEESQIPGVLVGDVVNKDVKHSTDLRVSQLQGWKAEDGFLFGVLSKHLSLYIKEFDEAFKNIGNSNDTGYLMQTYPPDSDGYVPHMDSISQDTASRYLACIFYLNTLTGGGTRFPYHDKTVEAVSLLFTSYSY